MESGTHTGRRTVVTTLFVEGDEALEDIARFVGHARPATTARCVKRLGRHPHAVAQRAAAILDSGARADDDIPRRFGVTPAKLGATPGATALHGPIRPNPMMDRRTR